MPRVRRLVLALLASACTPFPTAPLVRATPVEASVALPRIAVTEWRELGRSVGGRPIRARTIGYGPRQVLWIGGIHGNEPEGSIATASLPADFLAAGLAEAVTLTIIEDLNPDGRAANTRGNANKVDLNRNYPARTFVPSPENGPRPLSEPESKVLHDFVLEHKPDLIVVCHAWGGRHFINYDGPAEHLAKLFADLSGYPLVVSNTFNPTPGSLGQWVGKDLGRPILTLEWLKGKNWQEAWEETRIAALAVIAGR